MVNVDKTSIAERTNAPTVGSVFPSADDRWFSHTAEVPPWETQATQVKYLQSGRQALTAIIGILSKRSIASVAVPTYLCDSMLEPFVRAGWSLHHYLVDDKLSPIPESILKIVRNRSTPIAILGAHYFGRTPEQDYIDVISELTAEGVSVIEDESHRLFRPGQVDAEFAFASLRKLLPVADGAYIRVSQTSEIMDVFPSSRGLEHWNAMDAMKHAQDETALRNSRAWIQRENLNLESVYTPMTISERSLQTVHTLNYKKIEARRIQNACFLSDELQNVGYQILNAPTDSLVPSHLVVQLREPLLVQRRMAEKKVYCPIHYPRSELLPQSIEWRKDLLSLPIDHRYDLNDMELVISCLREADF